MVANKILKVVLVPLAICYIILQGKGMQVEAAGISAFMLVLLTILYILIVKNRRKYFFMFLTLFCITHVISYIMWFIPETRDKLFNYFYYGTNILYIISYIFLILNIVIDLNLRYIISKFSIPIIVLFVLDIFCVIVVSGTTEQVLNVYEYSLEFAYNAVIMILLSVALINYMYRNDNKSMLYLMGSICIVFSEIIQLAYYYVLQEDNLGLIYALFLVIAFLLLYIQSKLKFTGPTEAYVDKT